MTKSKEYPTQAELFDYCDGNLISKNSRGRIKAGDIAGTLKKDGYITIGINLKLYLAHRLVWIYHNGDIESEMIDHIDGNPSNNRIENLQQVSRSQNLQKKKNQKSITGYRGVYQNGNKFRVRIRIKGKFTHIGNFESAYIAAIHADVHNVINNGKFAITNFDNKFEPKIPTVDFNIPYDPNKNYYQ